MFSSLQRMSSTLTFTVTSSSGTGAAFRACSSRFRVVLERPAQLLVALVGDERLASEWRRLGRLLLKVMELFYVPVGPVPREAQVLALQVPAQGADVHDESNTPLLAPAV